MLDFQAARWLVEGEVAGQEGNNHPTAVPMGLFEAADGHVNIAAAGDVMFENLCRVAGAEELLADERFATGRARHANKAALERRARPVRGPAHRGRVGRRPQRRRHPVRAGLRHRRGVRRSRRSSTSGMARTIHDDEQGDITLVGQGFALARRRADVRPAGAGGGPAHRAGPARSRVLAATRSPGSANVGSSPPPQHEEINVTGTVELTFPEPGVALLEIDNPPVNAMSASMLATMNARVAEAQVDDAIRAIVDHRPGPGVLQRRRPQGAGRRPAGRRGRGAERLRPAVRAADGPPGRR